jgi:hypothetical protein
MIITAVGNFIAAYVPDIEITRNFENRVARPNGNYVALFEIMNTRIGTNKTEYTETTRNEAMFLSATIQADFYGLTSHDDALKIATLWRSDLPKQYGIVPLFASEPRFLPFISGERQIIPRWSIDLTIGEFKGYDLPQQTFNEATPTLIEAIQAAQ